jgi:hypothetical protein
MIRAWDVSRRITTGEGRTGEKESRERMTAGARDVSTSRALGSSLGTSFFSVFFHYTNIYLFLNSLCVHLTTPPSWRDCPPRRSPGHNDGWHNARASKCESYLILHSGPALHSGLWGGCLFFYSLSWMMFSWCLDRINDICVCPRWVFLNLFVFL